MSSIFSHGQLIDQVDRTRVPIENCMNVLNDHSCLIHKGSSSIFNFQQIQRGFFNASPKGDQLRQTHCKSSNTNEPCTILENLQPRRAIGSRHAINATWHKISRINLSGGGCPSTSTLEQRPHQPKSFSTDAAGIELSAQSQNISNIQ